MRIPRKSFLSCTVTRGGSWDQAPKHPPRCSVLDQHTDFLPAAGRLFCIRPRPLMSAWSSSWEKRFFLWESYYIVTCTVSPKVAYSRLEGLQQHLVSWRIVSVFFSLQLIALFPVMWLMYECRGQMAVQVVCSFPGLLK